jgi:1-acyl-sn-glycerol-3-phosphate acyltransferase
MMARLERLWRQCGTAISFALFGIGGVLMAVFIFPIVNLLFRDPERRSAIAQRTVHLSWRFFVRTMVVLRVIDFEAEGESTLSSETGTLIIANHPSLIDVVLIMSMMKRTQCVVKSGVWNNPFMRGAIRATNYIPNLGDPEQLVSDCVSALESGHNLVIFPEGSRTVAGQKPKLQRGFANIAIRAHAPIRLVAVSCDPPTLRKGEPWYQSPLSRPRFRVRVCERVDTESFSSQQIPSLAARSLTSYVAGRLEELTSYGTT